MMLFCTDTGKARDPIPSSLLGLYVRYKQDTRAIVAWLVSHGTEEHKRLKMLSIRDLLGLAEIAQKKAVYMPDTIDFQFREAIAARAHLTEYFRNTCRWSEAEEQVTCNHEYFTQRWA